MAETSERGIVPSDHASATDRDNAPPCLALRPKQAAKAIGISERLLWSKTNAGEIPHARIGRAVIYPVDLLREYLAERGVPPQRMRAIGQAHSVSITGNDSDKGRSANRRVEFVFVERPDQVDRLDLGELTGEPEAETGGNPGD